MQNIINKNKIEIIDWKDCYHDKFISLSIEWLEKYVSVEPADKLILNDPYGVVLKDGGMIFFAKYQNEIVGTVSMIYDNDASFELAKLAVTDKYKGLKIGNLLMERCIEFAKKNSAKKIFLYTNHNLIAALGLYEKYGFKKVSLSDCKYVEADIKMEKHF